MRIKKNIKLISLIILLSVIYSCKDKCDRSEEVNGGEIIKKYEISWNVNNEHSACIRNQQEFDDYAKSNNSLKASTELPSVDFSKHSILIYNIIESGCCIFNRNVAIDTMTKTVTYSIIHFSCGCGFKVAMDIWTVDNNMVLVPKIPVDYNVDFKYE